MNIRPLHFALMIAVGFFLTGTSSWAQAVTAISTFDPPLVREGDSIQYQFTLSSSEIDPRLESLSIPSVEGLEVQYVGTRSGREMNVGSGGFQQTIRQTYQFMVRAKGAGEYTMPAFNVSVAGQQVTIPAAKVKVLEHNAQGADGRDQAALFAELELPRENHYVGEAVLAKLKLFVDDQRVRSVRGGTNRPISIKEGDAFRVGDFDETPAKMVEKDGRVLLEYSWDVMITPLKTGPQPLVIQLDLVVGMASSSSAREPMSRIEQLFGGSFPSSFNQQRVSLYTEHEDLEILPLPTENKPAGFTGGIGMFTVDQPRLSTTTPMAGEPVTMTLVVRGQGNFDRMQPPVLATSDSWRDYEPETAFRAADATGYTGVKTFEYTIIPRDAGDLETPEIAFNFFNPDTAKYVELPIPGEAVTVRPNPNAKRPAPKVRNPVEARRGPELLPIASSEGPWVRSIRPIVTNPIFLGAQVLPALALGLFVVRRRKELRLENDAVYARRVRSAQMMKQELQHARQAAARQDAAAFYAAAQRGVQAAAGRHVAAAPESLTAAEVDSIAARQGLDEVQRCTLREFFEAGDAIRFSGMSGAGIDFASESKRLEQSLNILGGDAK
ncbi:MAG: BatD family protein [Puniceicoccales bacterium]